MKKRKTVPQFSKFKHRINKKIKEYKDYEDYALEVESSIRSIDVSTAEHYINIEVPKNKRKLKNKIRDYLDRIKELYKYSNLKSEQDYNLYREFFNTFNLDKVILM